MKYSDVTLEELYIANAEENIEFVCDGDKKEIKEVNVNVNNND